LALFSLSHRPLWACSFAQLSPTPQKSSLPNGYSIFSNALACGLEGGDFWIALTGETQKEEYSEGIALGYDGSGRWPDLLMAIGLQSSGHFTREQQIMKFATTAVFGARIEDRE